MVLTITYLYKCDFCILNDDQSECNVLTASDWLTASVHYSLSSEQLLLINTIIKYSQKH